MEFTGTDAVLQDLFRESERVARKAPAMLEAAGRVMVGSWRDAITEAGHAPPGKSGRATGALGNSVQASKPKKDKNDAYTTTVYPRGKDKRGTRLAEVAFVLHYGTSKHPGDHFVDRAEDLAEAPAQEAMARVWESD